MSLSEDSTPGAALASVLIHQTMIKLLVLHGVIPRDLTLEMLDTTLQTAEKMQADAENLGNAMLQSAARGARFHIDALRIALVALPLPQRS